MRQEKLFTGPPHGGTGKGSRAGLGHREGNMKFKYSSAHKPLRFLTMEILFLGPILIIFFLVKILPFLLSFHYAFTDWDGVTRTIHNIGLNNFILLAKDKEFLNSLWFTLKFSVVSVVLTNVLLSLIHI